MKLRTAYISLLFVFLIDYCRLPAVTDTLLLKRQADSLYAKGDYYAAGNFYQKASFYSLFYKNRIALLLKKVDCLKQEGRFSEAEELISRTGTELSDSLLSCLFSQGALCSYLAGDYKKAESYILQLEYRLSDKTLLKNHLVLLALILNEQARWNEARYRLIEYISYLASSDSLMRKDDLEKIDHLYFSKNYPHLKNPHRARVFSHIIPGWGQIYAGAVSEGIFSFMINAALLSATVVGIYFHYYITSIVAGNFLFGKFYLGNVNRAEFLVNKRNYIKANRFNQHLKEEILLLYK
jgi:tetratricopeptide (TPR) repeat protein